MDIKLTNTWAGRAPLPVQGLLRNREGFGISESVQDLDVQSQPRSQEKTFFLRFLI